MWGFDPVFWDQPTDSRRLSLPFSTFRAFSGLFHFPAAKHLLRICFFCCVPLLQFFPLFFPMAHQPPDAFRHPPSARLPPSASQAEVLGRPAAGRLPGRGGLPGPLLPQLRDGGAHRSLRPRRRADWFFQNRTGGKAHRMEGSTKRQGMRKWM